MYAEYVGSIFLSQLTVLRQWAVKERGDSTVPCTSENLKEVQRKLSLAAVELPRLVVVLKARNPT